MDTLRLQNLLIEHQRNPVGMDCSSPRLCWELTSDANDTWQTAYSIQIADRANSTTMDTGKIPSAQNTEIEIPRLSLLPMTEYAVTVRVWDNNGNEATISGTFETGKMGTAWNASWIEPRQFPTSDGQNDEEPSKDSLFDNPFAGRERDYKEFQPVQYIRIPFTINKNIAKARIYMTAHGIYRLYVNGKRVDEREFAPEITPYEKILMYQTYAITDFLEKGENVIGIELADGWWVGRIGMYGDGCQFGNTLGLLLEARIVFEDGSEQLVKGDEGKSSTGPLIFSDLFVGEKYDATKEIHGWNEPGYDDGAWPFVDKVSLGFENIVAQYGEPVLVFQEMSPEKVFRSPAGEWILDVGQVVAGYVGFCINAKGGTVIKLDHSEVLDESGNYYNNIIGRNKEQRDIYIAKDGFQSYRPHFTYHGFRFVRVTGWPGEPRREDFKIFCLTSEMDTLNRLETSDWRINRLMENIWWSQVANTISIPTDCPQRERAGWGGDVMVFAPTMCKLRRADAFLTRWMNGVRAEQLENGAIPKIVPYLKCYRDRAKITTKADTCCGWGDTILQVPLAMYREYGDKRVLLENYEAMKRWLGYIENRAANNHPEDYAKWDEERKSRSKYLWNTDFHYGDWLVPSMVLGNTDGKAMIKTARATMKYVAPGYFANSANTMAEIAGILGFDTEQRYYATLYEKIKKAFIEEYVTPDGRMPVELQGLYVIALKNHLFTEELRPKMVTHLVEMIQNNGGCLDTGFLSVHYLLDVLCENGQRDVAYQLLFQTKCPSWLYEVEHGATTIWESWGAIGENGEVSTYSYNHYAFGCVGDWIIREICGIQCVEPGYKMVRINPAYDCGLSRVNCTQHTPNGELGVHWILHDKAVELSVQIPCNTTADVVFPDSAPRLIGSGKYQYSIRIE